MPNTLYSTPLHGVDLFLLKETKQFANNSNRNKVALPASLDVSEGTIDLSPNIKPAWQLNEQSARYHSQITLYRINECTWVLDIKCEGSGKFAITPNSITIDWQAGGTDATHYFQTLALSLWLELQNVPCIHANAMVINNKCVAFIGPSGMGKSTLSSYVQQRGEKWLTDDMLALHQSDNKQNYVVYPSWPKARMWPDSVQAVAKQNVKTLARVHERFDKVELNLPKLEAHTAFNLDAIYVLNRNGAELASLQNNPRLVALGSAKTRSAYLTNSVSGNGISKVGSSMALLALLQNSMLGNAYSRLGLEHTRLSQLGALVNALPIKQIHYNNGYQSLIDVYELIRHDLNSR